MDSLDFGWFIDWLIARMDGWSDRFVGWLNRIINFSAREDGVGKNIFKDRRKEFRSDIAISFTNSALQALKSFRTETAKYALNMYRLG